MKRTFLITLTDASNTAIKVHGKGRNSVAMKFFKCRAATAISSGLAMKIELLNKNTKSTNNND
jgi:hypothetical protein